MCATRLSELQGWHQSLQRLRLERSCQSPGFFKPYHFVTMALLLKEQGAQQVNLPPEFTRYAARMRRWEAIGLESPLEVAEKDSGSKFHELTPLTDLNAVGDVSASLSNVILKNVGKPCTADSSDSLYMGVDDGRLREIWKHADVCLRDAMDLAYLTGQRPSDVLGMTQMDVRDGFVHVQQSKTKKGATRGKLRIEVSPELQSLLDRIAERKRGHKAHNTRLVVNEFGRPIGLNAMSRRWVAACTAAKVEGLQFRDLRAKAGTDKTESAGDIRQAQTQLGHSSVVMTEHYVRKRRGAKVTPTR